MAERFEGGENRERAREILENAFGPPANEQRRQVIEAILDKMYGPAETLDS